MEKSFNFLAEERISTPKKKRIINPEELRKEAEDFISFNKDILDIISGDSSLQYQVGEGSHIQFLEGKVQLGLELFKWKHELNGEKDAPLWACCHELAHFADLVADPEGLLSNFQKSKELAREKASFFREILNKRFSKLPAWIDKERVIDEKTGEKMTGLELFLTSQRNKFYNYLDDIYVNRFVGVKLSQFGAGTSPMVKRLYRDFLFPAKARGEESGAEDLCFFMGMRVDQFGGVLLRQRMVPDQRILCHPDVYNTLSKNFFGTSLTDLTEQITTPDPNLKHRKDLASLRYSKIEQFLEPEFWRLLELDFSDMEIPLDDPCNKGEGEGERSKGKISNKKPDKNSITEMPFDIEEVKKFIEERKKFDRSKKRQENKKKRYERLTPEQKKDYYDRQESLDFYRAHQERLTAEGVTAEHIMSYEALKKSVEPYRDDLATIFERAINTIEKQISFAWEKYFYSGRLDVKRLLKRYSHFFSSEEEDFFIPFDRLEAYERKEFIEKLKLQPDEFRLRFLFDNSGSMKGDIMHSARQMMVLFSEALNEFQSRLENRFRELNLTKPPILVNTQVIVWGEEDKMKEVKPLLRNGQARNGIEDRIMRYAAFAKMDASHEDTVSFPAWELVDATFLPEDRKRIKERKLVDITLETTDGLIRDSQKTRNIIHALKGKDKETIITKAFLIDLPIIDEKGEKIRGPYSEQARTVFFGIHGNAEDDLNGDGVVVETVSDYVEKCVILLSQQIDKALTQIEVLSSDN